MALTILNILVACLSDESNEFLYKNEIFISTYTSKPPLFNYPEFYLSELHCNSGSYSGLSSEFFYQLSQICHNVTFLKLQSLSILYNFSNPEYIMKFLENNGKKLKEFYRKEVGHDLNLSIVKTLNNNELDTLRIIFNSCQYLESTEICQYCFQRFRIFFYKLENRESKNI
ncbi:hypothetical protein C1645_828059 [Glomus cerebriforme]|uniref:Uncharacterized protein n=1 Tax=Glomus cerebriforme TaxID=658196 RepID=A0A397SNG9_9GLOM|nr:hypothetical protein C1645_828059 [Glomus cerebriforme]